jgi:hypothetical protein
MKMALRWLWKGHNLKLDGFVCYRQSDWLKKVKSNDLYLSYTMYCIIKYSWNMITCDKILKFFKEFNLYRKFAYLRWRRRDVCNFHMIYVDISFIIACVSFSELENEARNIRLVNIITCIIEESKLISENMSPNVIHC